MALPKELELIDLDKPPKAVRKSPRRKSKKKTSGKKLILEVCNTHWTAVYDGYQPNSSTLIWIYRILINPLSCDRTSERSDWLAEEFN